MQHISFKNKMMLACMAFLVLVTASIFVRLATAQLLVRKLHIDNALTRTILSDVQVIFMPDVTPEHPEVKIPWHELYPFANGETAADNAYTRLTARLQAATEKIKFIEDKKVGKWSSEWLVQGRRLIELGRYYEPIIGWRILNPEHNTYEFRDGYWTYALTRTDMSGRVEAVRELQALATANGAQLLFVQAPYKTNKYGDAEVNGWLDFANANADELLTGLAASGIKTFDLRAALGAGLTDEEYHQLFFRTDHHWTPRTALKAAGLLGKELAAMGIAVDGSHFSPADYTVELRPQSFLGSQGRKVTLAHTAADDFEIYHPKFSSLVQLTIPDREVAETGTFDVFYDKQALIDCGDVYNQDFYHAYGYSDRPLLRADNLLLADYPEQKVLILRDSLGDTLIPFLSTGVKHIIALDLRGFSGSLKTFVERERPDVIVVMYTASYARAANAKTRMEGPKNFDFR